MTFEFNPDDCDKNYLKSLKEIGINRLSIGSQTFNDRILKFIGRRHNSEDIEKVVKTAQEVGFNNISVDLIYGLPTQTITDIQYDLNKFEDLNIQHVSTYGLKIEEGSFWYNNKPKELPDEDSQADMYEFINEELEKKGFLRYEISNFSLNGFESKHNLNYWNNEEYYGFGVAAHGYVDGVRYSNFENLEKYLQNPVIHEQGRVLTTKEKLEEEIFLGFRKTDGIDTTKIKNIYDFDFEQEYKEILKKYSKYIIKTQNGYSLNTSGVLISNLILSEFL